MPNENPKKRFKTLIKIVLVTMSLAFAIPVGHLFIAHLKDRAHPLVLPPENTLNDASFLNQTAGSEIIALSSDLEETRKQLRETFKKSGTTGRPVSIGGARHSMGGHSLNPDGIYIDTDGFNAR